MFSSITRTVIRTQATVRWRSIQTLNQVYMGNFPSGFTKTQLDDILKQRSVSNFLSTSVTPYGCSSGSVYGTVTFSSEKLAKFAVEALQDLKVGNRLVDSAIIPDSSTLVARYKSLEILPNVLTSLIRSFLSGEEILVRVMEDRKVVNLTLTTPQLARRVLIKLQEYKVNGKTLTFTPAPNYSIRPFGVYVTNMSADSYIADVKWLVEKEVGQGEIASLNIPFDTTGTHFYHYVQ